MNRSILFFLPFFGKKKKKIWLLFHFDCGRLLPYSPCVCVEVGEEQDSGQDNEPEWTRLYTQALRYTDTHIHTKRERNKESPQAPSFPIFRPSCRHPTPLSFHLVHSMAATSLSLSPTLTVRLRPHAFYPTQSCMQAFCKKKKVILKLNKNNHRKRFSPPRYRNMPLLRRFCFCCFHLNRTERPKE